MPRRIRISILVVLIAVLLIPLTRPYWDRDYALEQFMTRHDLRGVSLAYGPLDGDPVIEGIRRAANAPAPYYSLSKPLTALAILEAHQRGRLSLDDRIGTASLEQVLKHTGGWDRTEVGDPVLSAPQGSDCTRLDPPPVQFTPGDRYAYSNLGYCLAGRRLGAAMGGTYEEAVRAVLPESADMSYDAYIGPAGGWAGTARQFWDLAARDLPAAVTANPMPRPGDTPYGLGWGVDADGRLSHFGWLTSADNFTAAQRSADSLVIALFDGVPADPERAKRELRDLMVRFES